MRQYVGQFLAAAFLACAITAAEGDFARVKSQLAEAAYVTLDFISIVESDVFDTVDTTAGTAHLAHDGRYRIDIGDDTYLNDGEQLYSYSRENNQVTIETSGEPDELSEVSFITRLDEVYATVGQTGNGAFLLEKIDTLQTDLPNRLTVHLDSSRSRLARLDFVDINDDRNSIVIQRQQIDSTCPSGSFAPDFPDSVEQIRLF